MNVEKKSYQNLNQDNISSYLNRLDSIIYNNNNNNSNILPKLLDKIATFKIEKKLLKKEIEKKLLILAWIDWVTNITRKKILQILLKNTQIEKINLSDTLKYYNYSLNRLKKTSCKRFKWEKWKIEHKELISSRRLKVYKYINKYLSFLSPIKKESFANILFFESVYWKYTKHKNKDWTIDYWPCMINNWKTFQELKKNGIVKKEQDLKNWDINFKAAAYIIKKYWFNRWHWRVQAQKAGLYKV